MLDTALDAYRRFYAQDRAGQILAFTAAGLTVPLHVVLALLLERIARLGSDAWTLGFALTGVAALILALEVLMDSRLLGATLFRPMRRVQLAVFSRFLDLPPRRYPDVASGDLASAAIQYMGGTYFLRDTLRMVHGLLNVVALGVVIGRSSVWLGLLATLPLLAVGTALHLLRTRYLSTQTKERVARSRLDTYLTDTLHGTLTVKLCGWEHGAVAQLGQLSTEHQRHWLRLQLQRIGFSTVLNSLAYMMIPVFLAVGGYLISGGAMTAAELLSSYAIFNLISYHAYQANGLVSYVLYCIGTLRHITDFLSGETEGRDPIELTHGAIGVRDVSFGYEGRPGVVLDGVSLDISPGEKVAIVGASGCGKTTLLALLLGIQHPGAGVVSVDGIPVGPHNAAALRRGIATVGQSAHLFDADVAFNLTLGKECPPEDVERVLRIVGLDGFLAALPEGMATRFGAGGFAISGGEKARLCLARALLMDRRVLLLDEVTAQIDAAHERDILTNVLHHTPGTTVVAISHRLSSVRDFPRIILLDNGSIADQGTHDQLLERCPRYRELFGRQIAA